MQYWLRFISLIILTSLACSLSVGDAPAMVNDPQALNEDRPSVLLLSPAQGNRYAVGTEIFLHAEAADLGAGVAKIEFYDNFDEVIGLVNAINPDGDPRLTAIVPWQIPSEAQTHFVKARAFRVDGTQSGLEEVAIEAVIPDPLQQPPTQTPSPVPSITPSPDPNAGANPVATEPPSDNGESAAPITTTLAATVNVDAVNVRVAPATNAQIAAPPLQNGTTIELVGRSEDSTWVTYLLPSGNAAWVFAAQLDINGAPSTLPLVATP